MREASPGYRRHMCLVVGSFAASPVPCVLQLFVCTHRGIGAATLRLVPMACVSFGTYELVRSAIVAWEQRLEEHQVKQMLHSRWAGGNLAFFPGL